MKLKVENLGYIKKGEIELGDLTIIAGKNNTGKTYLSYVIFTFLDTFSINFRVEPKDIIEHKLIIDTNFFKKHLKSLSIRMTKSLHSFFAVEEDFFKSSILNFILDENTLFEFFKNRAIPKINNVNTNKIINTDKNSSKEKNKKYTISAEMIDDEKICLYIKFHTDLNIEYTEQADYEAHMFSIYICDIMSNFIDPFAITSERTGISLFYKQLDSTKSAILDLMEQQIIKQREKKDINTYEMMSLLNKSLAKYAYPIKENINIIRDVDSIIKENSILKQEECYDTIIELLKKVSGGKICIKKDKIFFSSKGNKVPLHISSSAIKSLLLLDLFINHIAKKNSILIIDEPELNLHPEAQRNMARLLVQLVNYGIKIIITTHSDYIVREINNLIMLSKIEKEVREALLKKFKYYGNEYIDSKKIKAYVCSDKGKIIPVEQNEYGFSFDTFDCLINESTRIGNTIVELVDNNE